MLMSNLLECIGGVLNDCVGMPRIIHCEVVMGKNKQRFSFEMWEIPGDTLT